MGNSMTAAIGAGLQAGAKTGIELHKENLRAKGAENIRRHQSKEKALDRKQNASQHAAEIDLKTQQGKQEAEQRERLSQEKIAASQAKKTDRANKGLVEIKGSRTNAYDEKEEYVKGYRREMGDGSIEVLDAEFNLLKVVNPRAEAAETDSPANAAPETAPPSSRTFATEEESIAKVMADAKKAGKNISPERAKQLSDKYHTIAPGADKPAAVEESPAAAPTVDVNPAASKPEPKAEAPKAKSRSLVDRMNDAKSDDPKSIERDEVAKKVVDKAKGAISTSATAAKGKQKSERAKKLANNAAKVAQQMKKTGAKPKGSAALNSLVYASEEELQAADLNPDLLRYVMELRNKRKKK